MKPTVQKALTKNESGSVSLEMLLAALPVLFTFLGVLQLALFQIAQLVVTHAATRAVRAAVVVLNDAPESYASEPRRGDLTDGAAESRGGLFSWVNGIDDKYAKLLSGEKRVSGARMQQIRDAAYHPLAVLAPPLQSYLGKDANLEAELGSSPWGRITAGLLGYGPGATSVTVHQNGAETPSHVFEPGGSITVRISFLFPCGVPLVSAIACTGGRSLVLSNLGLPLEEEHAEDAEKMRSVESPVTRDLLLALGGRFTVLSAAATLPNQSARYHGQ